MNFHSCGSPIFTHLAAWKDFRVEGFISPDVLKAAFNVDPDTEKLFRSKRTSDAVFFAPPS
jgi:hypothetical protein